MIKIVERIETYVIYALVVMLLLSVLLGTVQLGRVLIDMVVQPPFLLIEPAALFYSFGLFLIILIGLELLKLLKLHLLHHNLRPEVVIEVAIIAVCNKIVQSGSGRIYHERFGRGGINSRHSKSRG